MDRAFHIFPSLIRLAARCGSAADFQQLLRELTIYANADGCIIWEIFVAGTPERRYFKLTDYFLESDEKTQPNWHFLPEASATGKAIRANEPEIVDDVETAAAAGVIPGIESLRARGIRTFCCIPISFGLNREASINFYRKENRSFEPDLDRLRAVADIIPELNAGVMNRIGFQLLQDIGNDLNGHGDVLKPALERVAKHFNANEAAIYLEEESPGIYERKAGIWEFDYPAAKAYWKGDPGLTVWAIENRQQVRFVDLAHFEDERTKRKYEGMKWPSQENLLRNALKIYGEHLPPIGFVCVPIIDRNKAVGAIRCCMTRSAPHLFDESHIAILNLVAEQIGHWWGNTQDLRREKADIQCFRDLLQGIGQMDDNAINSLRSASTPEMATIWQRALMLVKKISPWPEALSVRIVDERAQELRLVATLGKAWATGRERRHRPRIDRFSLTEESVGVRAVKLRKVIVEAEAGQPEHFRSELFPDATKLIHVPILFGNRALGVLDILGFGPHAIPANLPLMCELIARQMSLYYNLTEQFQRQRDQEVKLARQNQEQNQIYEDFLHQLRNPLVKAMYLAEQAAWGRRRVDPRQLEAFVRQALQFSESLNHYIALAREEKLTPDIEKLSHSDLMDRLQQLAAEEACIVPPNRGLTFRVEQSTFEPFRDKYILVARDLLDNCVFNLLDNAAKYSFSKSEVLIRGRFFDDDRTMAISVLNRGHKILTTDRVRLVQRGERGAAALRSTAGGRGIGLWIVDKFMQAMDATLRIIPTDGRGQNEFQLIFRYRFGR